MKRKRTRGIGPVVAITLGCFLVSPWAREAHAITSGQNTIWETIGFSTAVGTVLGASTLPFYEEPGQHITNVAIGASVGLIGGLGYFLAGRFQSTMSDPVTETTHLRVKLPVLSGDLPVVSRSSLWLPMVSLTW